MVTLKEVCSYCGFVIKDGVEPISHGICEPCLVTQIKEVELLPDLRASGSPIQVYGFRVLYVAPLTLKEMSDTINSPEGVLVAEDSDGRETVRMSLEQVPMGGVPPEFEKWHRLNPPLQADKLAKWYAPRIVSAVEFLLHPEGGKTFSVVPLRFAE